MATTSDPAAYPIPPKRGGFHPTYGDYIGGSKLGDDYTLTEGANLYRFTTQCRNKKATADIEKSLREARDSNKEIKFNGTLEPVPGRELEIGKERFVTLLKKRVKEHGQQTFYHIRDDNNKVVDLFEHSHRFKLSQVIDEHKRSLTFYRYTRYEVDLC